MKYKVEVSKVYVQEHVVEAESIAHAMEIASEISEEMEATQKTFFESEWKATPIVGDEKVTYEPQQEYLK